VYNEFVSLQLPLIWVYGMSATKIARIMYLCRSQQQKWSASWILRSPIARGGRPKSGQIQQIKITEWSWTQLLEAIEKMYDETSEKIMGKKAREASSLIIWNLKWQEITKWIKRRENRECSTKKLEKWTSGHNITTKQHSRAVWNHTYPFQKGI
jgi:hypothetical protein